MKIPGDAHISDEKLKVYLLSPRNRNDKSGFLLQVGFDRNNSHLLEDALHRLIRENEAQIERESEYGTLYRVKGNLTGPHGILTVVTIWIRVDAESHFRFVTMKPAR